MKTPFRVGFLLAPFSAVLLALAVLLLLPSLAFSGPKGPRAVARGKSAQAPAGCRPLSGEDANICKQMVELEVRDVVPLSEAQTHAVLLVSKDGEQMLPIFVDEAAAVAIAFRLAHLAPPHPLAQDLLDTVVGELGGTVSQVRIDGLKDDIFVGRIVIDQGGRAHALDARPSDSIAMALSGNAPILAHREVLAEAGLDKREADSLMGDLGVGGSGPPADEGLGGGGPEGLEPRGPRLPGTGKRPAHPPQQEDPGTIRL